MVVHQEVEDEECTAPPIRLWVSEEQNGFIANQSRKHLERVDAMPLIKPAGMGDCPQCSFGLISPPPLTGSLPLYRERCLQYDMHELTFCECRTGQDYRRYLVKKSRTENEREAKEAQAFNRSEAAK